ncbi:MAG TPA: hypothetical protein VF353_01095 [Candidatus Binatia bacterium]
MTPYQRRVKKGCIAEKRAINFTSQIKAIRQHPLLLGLFFLLGVFVGAGITTWRPTDPAGRMGYRDLSNEELSEKGAAMARALRALARELMAADEKLRSRCDKETELAKTEQARNQLRQSCNDESLKATQSFLARYEDKYKAEVLILREEMLHRLPELRPKTVPPVLASHPTNALGLGEVASTLEVLAKLLPKMPSKA